MACFEREKTHQLFLKTFSGPQLIISHTNCKWDKNKIKIFLSYTPEVNQIFTVAHKGHAAKLIKKLLQIK